MHCCGALAGILAAAASLMVKEVKFGGKIPLEFLADRVVQK
jgi:hypothetical protein